MRKNLIAKIHIAKKDLCIDDDCYRQMLANVTGKDSCSLMSSSELDAVLKHCKALGWKAKLSKNSDRKLSPKTRNKLAPDMVDKIRAMWIDMHKIGMIDNGTEAALDAWVKRTTTQLNKGQGIDRVEWLRGDAQKRLTWQVLESLKKWHSRVLKQWQNDDLRFISVEQNRSDLSQVQVTQRLLNENVIFWWPIFSELGIPDASKYCCMRSQLERV